MNSNTKYVLVDYMPEKPCEMDDANVHAFRNARGGDDCDTQIVAKVMRDIRNMSDRQQLLFGAAVGFLSGYLLTKTGKYVCICFGAGVIVLQLAGQNDYIKFNLLRALSADDVHRTTTSEPRSQGIRPIMARFFRKLHSFLLEQPNLTSGVIGGFLIGIGFS